ncbi:MAG: hypothetical protein IKO11_05695 [Lachnospiraceae bacterium]|nr:hypothetical protein [Lachnospiraceae bacterium]
MKGKALLTRLAGSLASAAAVVMTAGSLSAQAAPEVMADGTVFDAEYYADTYTDVVKVFGTRSADVMYKHYLKYGKKEGRNPVAPGTDVEAVKKKAAQAAKQQTNAATVVRPATNAAKADSLQDYFNRSVFIGDSVMVGYKLYLANHPESASAGTNFLAVTSYATYHALNERSNMHPLYRGVCQPVWTSISQMGVDRAFIMLGTNDLVCYDPARTAGGIFALADRIHEVNPNVEVILISMPPVYATTNKGSLNNTGIDSLNVLLKDGCEEHNTSFVEINSFLKDAGGGLAPAYCSDRYVHETFAAYGDVWDVQMQNFASEALKK